MISVGLHQLVASWGRKKTICLPERTSRPRTADAQPTLPFRRGKKAVHSLVFSRGVLPNLFVLFSGRHGHENSASPSLSKSEKYLVAGGLQIELSLRWNEYIKYTF